MTDLSSALAGALEFVHTVNPSARGEEADGWGPAVGDRGAGEAPAPLDTASKACSGWGKGHQRGPGAASPAARIHSRGRRWRKAEGSAVSRWTARGTPRENAPYQFPVAPVRNDHGLCGLKQREFILSLVARRPKSRWGQGRGGGGRLREGLPLASSRLGCQSSLRRRGRTTSISSHGTISSSVWVSV